MGLVPALIAGGGSLLGGALGLAGQSSANASNQQIAQEQMNFQEQMSSSAWQRGVQDMEKAGINPMAALGSGGASAPSGAAIAMQNPVPSQLVSSAVSSALDYARTAEQIKNVRADTAVKGATQMLTTANAAQAAAQIPTEQAKGVVANTLLPTLKTIGNKIQPIGSSAGSVLDWTSDAIGSALGPAFGKPGGVGLPRGFNPSMSTGEGQSISNMLGGFE